MRVCIEMCFYISMVYATIFGRLLIFANYVRELDHFTLDLLKRLILNTGASKKTTMNESLNVRL